MGPKVRGEKATQKLEVLNNVNFSAEISGIINLECHILDLSLSITVIEMKTFLKVQRISKRYKIARGIYIFFPLASPKQVTSDW